MLRFQFNEIKAIEALVYVARNWPRITPFFASKVMFFAEKRHVNEYGRPIVADQFYAMENGPVPSTIYDYFKGKIDFVEDAERFKEAISFSGSPPEAVAAREPDLDMLSASDIECLDRAIEFCKGKSFGYLSGKTHQEPAWREANLNGPMDYELFVRDDNPDKDSIVEELHDFSEFGVL